jgi:hypothetical protein
MGVITILGGYFFLSDDLSVIGSLVALVTIAAILAVVVSCGVSISAISHSTVVGIAILWLGLYGLGFALTQLPSSYPTPDRLLANLPNVLRGYYDLQQVIRLLVAAVIASTVVAIVGCGYFSRRDV